MKKTIINPDAGSQFVSDWDEMDTVAFSRGVVVEMDGYKRVFISGLTAPGGDIGAAYEKDDAGDGKSMGDQTRDILARFEEFLEEFGGSMDDVVRVRLYTSGGSTEASREIHVARHEFFDRDHFPASAMVEVEDLTRGNIEIDADAIIPDDEWETDAVEI